MNIAQLFAKLKAMGLGGKPFEIAELPPADNVGATDLFPLLRQSGPAAYKYWGMSINASISASAGRILYLEFRQVAGVEEPATGGTAFASGTTGSPTLAYNDNGTSLDGNSTTVPLVSWYEFPEAISVEQVALKYGTLRQQKPADITIIASNDGENWETIFEKMDYTAADYGGNSAAGTLLIDIGGESTSEQLTASAEQVADYVAASGKVVPALPPHSSFSTLVELSATGVYSNRIVSDSAGGGRVPLYRSGGQLQVGSPTASTMAVRLVDLNARMSQEQRAAIDALDPTTATLEELITALQTPAAPAALNMSNEEDETL